MDYLEKKFRDGLEDDRPWETKEKPKRPSLGIKCIRPRMFTDCREGRTRANGEIKIFDSKPAYVWDLDRPDICHITKHYYIFGYCFLTVESTEKDKRKWTT